MSEQRLKLIRRRGYLAELGVAPVEGELILIQLLVDLPPADKDRSLSDSITLFFPFDSNY
jgi:hypothetical protein